MLWHLFRVSYVINFAWPQLGCSRDIHHLRSEHTHLVNNTSEQAMLPFGNGQTRAMGLRGRCASVKGTSRARLCVAVCPLWVLFGASLLLRLAYACRAFALELRPAAAPVLLLRACCEAVPRQCRRSRYPGAPAPWQPRGLSQCPGFPR